VHEHRVVHRFDQTLKQLLPIVQLRTAVLQILEQFIDCGAELAQRAWLGGQPDAPGLPPSSIRC